MTASSQITDILTSSYRHVASLDYDLPQSLVGVWLSCGPEFQLEYDIETDEGADALVYWWLSEGRRGYPGVRDVLDRHLFTTLHAKYSSRVLSDAEVVMTPLLSLLYSQRKDLRDTFDLNSPLGISFFWRWWLRTGQQEIMGEAEWPAEVQIESLRSVKVLNTGKLPLGQVLPNELVFVYALRPDLQQSFNVEAEAGSLAFLMWWLSFGALDLGKLGQAINYAVMQDLHWNFLPKILQTGKLSLTPLLAAVHAAAGLPFDVKKKAGISAIWQWWLESASRSYPHSGADAKQTLRQISDIPNPQFKLPLGQLLPNVLVFIFALRLDLQKVFDIRTEAGASALLMWWFTSGSLDFGELSRTVNRALMLELHWRHPAATTGADEFSLTPFLAFVREARPDLRQAFDTKTRDGVSALRRWWIEHGIDEYLGAADLTDGSDKQLLSIQSGGLLHTDAVSEGSARADSLARFSLQENHASYAPGGQSIGNSATAPMVSQPAEVCLVGYSRGEFGLGEDARLLRAALESQGITPSVVRPTWHITARQEIDDVSIDDTQAQFDSDVIFYVMPAFDTVTLMNKVGPRAFSARRKIGFWQWELSNFPPSAKLAMNFVDEIWCHSEHSAEAFRNATDKPVIKVPLPVLVREPKTVARESFGLPPNGFVVLTAYDGASSVARKNPLGSILAFRQAFTDKGIDACLVVKAMNTNNDSLWRECVRMAAGQRIIIIDEVLDRQTYDALLRNCDAVISLHRAEGFGRLMAEAMALGIPAIASRYSGNLDFMTDANSWLIDGRLIPVMPGDYPFYQDQVWLEPDIAQAAGALWECATNPAMRKQRGEAGRRDIARYGIEVCGKAYRDLLKTPAGSLRTSGARKMRIFVIARDIQRHDAVGNFCRQLQELLTAHEFELRLVAGNCHPHDRSSIAHLPEAIAQIAPDDVVIFHFSTEDPAFATIAALENPKVLYFHNITPDHFFSGVDEPAATLARLGFEQLPLARSFDVLMTNSAVTARVLHDGLAPTDQQQIPESRIVVCPPFVGIDRWDRIRGRDEIPFADERTILSVGRLAPHKGTLQLIDGFEVLALRDPSVKLLFVASSATSYYTSIIVERVDALAPAVASRIRFLHGIADDELKTIYEKIGICASMSFHEGFGIPLVDALVFDKPLVIQPEAGMMETAGDAAIVVADTAPASIADALTAALDDEATRQRLARARRSRLATIGKLADGHLILEAVNAVRRTHRARVV